MELRRLRYVWSTCAAAVALLVAASFAGVAGPDKAEAGSPALLQTARTALLSVGLSVRPSIARGAPARVQFVITIIVGEDDIADIILDWGDGTPPFTDLRQQVRRYNDGVPTAHFYSTSGRFTPQLTVRLYNAGTTGTTAVVVTVLPSFELPDNEPDVPSVPDLR